MGMEPSRKLVIICTACGAESLLVRRPTYEGFKRTGETLHCASCGLEFGSEADVPFKEDADVPRIFSEADKPATLRVFGEHENRRLCRHCANYLVNPFTQWCGLHRKEVEATDTCDRFEERKEKSPPL